MIPSVSPDILLCWLSKSSSVLVSPVPLSRHCFQLPYSIQAKSFECITNCVFWHSFLSPLNFTVFQDPVSVLKIGTSGRMYCASTSVLYRHKIKLCNKSSPSTFTQLRTKSLLSRRSWKNVHAVQDDHTSHAVSVSSSRSQSTHAWQSKSHVCKWLFISLFNKIHAYYYLCFWQCDQSTGIHIPV